MSDIIHLFSGGKIEQSGHPIEMYTRQKQGLQPVSLASGCPGKKGK